MTVGALLGTERRRFIWKTPKWISWIFGKDAIIIEEDRDGVSSIEILMWQAYYELENERQKRK